MLIISVGCKDESSEAYEKTPHKKKIIPIKLNKSQYKTHYNESAVPQHAESFTDLSSENFSLEKQSSQKDNVQPLPLSENNYFEDKKADDAQHSGSTHFL